MDGEDVGALYRRYVDEYARFAFQEIDFLHLLKDQSATPEGFAFEAPFSRQKLRFRGVIRHEIEWIKASYAEEFEHLCDALADGAQLDAWLDDVIAHDPVYGSVARERREAFRRELRRDVRRAARAIEPLVDRADVWPAIRELWSVDGAQHRLMRWFDATRCYGDFIDDVTMTVDTTSVALVPMDTVDYSREMLRVLDRGRDYIRRVVAADVEAAFAEKRPLLAGP